MTDRLAALAAEFVLESHRFGAFPVTFRRCIPELIAVARAARKVRERGESDDFCELEDADDDLEFRLAELGVGDE